MTSQFEPLDDILAVLRDQHRQVAPPLHLEARLQAAARAARPRRSLWKQLGAVAAAIVFAAVVWQVERPEPRPVARFLPLPGSEALPPPLATSILRMRLPLGDLRQYGFPVPPSSASDLVAADFVVGDDGLARAIRFVR